MAMIIQLNEHNYREFTDHLREHQINFSRRIMLQDTPTMAGMAIELMQSIPWDSMAVVIAAWLAGKRSRYVKFPNGEIYWGYSAKDIKNIKRPDRIEFGEDE